MRNLALCLVTISLIAAAPNRAHANIDFSKMFSRDKVVINYEGKQLDEDTLVDLIDEKQGFLIDAEEILKRGTLIKDKIGERYVIGSFGQVISGIAGTYFLINAYEANKALSSAIRGVEIFQEKFDHANGAANFALAGKDSSDQALGEALLHESRAPEDQRLAKQLADFSKHLDKAKEDRTSSRLNKYIYSTLTIGSALGAALIFINTYKDKEEVTLTGKEKARLERQIHESIDQLETLKQLLIKLKEKKKQLLQNTEATVQSS
ncbi:MAG: hypothetical protein AB7F43_03660 [Bacteriovoracia bacterium]